MFNIIRSNKDYIQGKEQFIVEHDGHVLLRVAGEETIYKAFTATAGEDASHIPPYPDQGALMRATEKACKELEGGDHVKKLDHNHKPYVMVSGTFDYISDVHRFAERVIHHLKHEGHIES